VPDRGDDTGHSIGSRSSRQPRVPPPFVPVVSWGDIQESSTAPLLYLQDCHDARACVACVHPVRHGPARLGLVGHSEGAIDAPIIATKEPALPNLDRLFVYDTDGFPGNYVKLPAPVRMRADVVGTIVDRVVVRLRS
jgi:hypothetical protein